AHFKRGNLNVPGKQFIPVFGGLSVRSLFKKTAKIIFRIFTVGFCGFAEGDGFFQMRTFT
ncbi:MAG: hypothetical protein SOX78_04985, partial [Treponema sp.]|nr:hypothetical protein [Treponema sp.]